MRLPAVCNGFILWVAWWAEGEPRYKTIIRTQPNSNTLAIYPSISPMNSDLNATEDDIEYESNKD